MSRQRSFPETVIHYKPMWFVVMFTALGLMVLALGAANLWFGWQYHISKPIRGAVLQTKRLRCRNCSGGYNVRIEYEYRTALGAVWTGADYMSHSYGDRFRPGDSIDVYFVRKFPSHSQLSNEMELFFPGILLLLGLVFTFVSLVGVYCIGSDLRREYLKAKHPHVQRTSR
jgi:hypothetical protein